jgi:hypothetical protein
LREDGADLLADQVHGLAIVSFCTCVPRCSAFRAFAADERPSGRVTTSVALSGGPNGIVLVDAVGDVIVGLDILDDGQLRDSFDRYAGEASEGARPSSTTSDQ